MFLCYIPDGVCVDFLCIVHRAPPGETRSFVSTVVRVGPVRGGLLSLPDVRDAGREGLTSTQEGLAAQYDDPVRQ
jgi:hypothetical protein